jgi:hypothetical protein
MWRMGRAPNSIPIHSYIQQHATSHSLFISGNCSTCIGWHFHPSSGAHTTVSTASGICHTVTAICRHHGRVGSGLSVLWVAYDKIAQSGYYLRLVCPSFSICLSVRPSVRPSDRPPARPSARIEHLGSHWTEF